MLVSRRNYTQCHGGFNTVAVVFQRFGHNKALERYTTLSEMCESLPFINYIIVYDTMIVLISIGCESGAFLLRECISDFRLCQAGARDRPTGALVDAADAICTRYGTISDDVEESTGSTTTDSTSSFVVDILESNRLESFPLLTVGPHMARR